MTETEFEVLRLMAAEAGNAEIADRLDLSESAVKSHVKSIFRKLGVRNRTSALARYLSR